MRSSSRTLLAGTLRGDEDRAPASKRHPSPRGNESQSNGVTGARRELLQARVQVLGLPLVGDLVHDLPALACVRIRLASVGGREWPGAVCTHWRNTHMGSPGAAAHGKSLSPRPVLFTPLCSPGTFTVTEISLHSNSP